MTWIWILICALVAYGGLRYRVRIREVRGPSGPPSVDDAAIRRILEDGTITTHEDEPLDMDEAAEAEEDFWSESWDEPDEFQP